MVLPIPVARASPLDRESEPLTDLSVFLLLLIAARLQHKIHTQLPRRPTTILLTARKNLTTRWRPPRPARSPTARAMLLSVFVCAQLGAATRATIGTLIAVRRLSRTWAKMPATTLTVRLLFMLHFLFLFFSLALHRKKYPITTSSFVMAIIRHRRFFSAPPFHMV